jgi:hypothetical protein
MALGAILMIELKTGPHKGPIRSEGDYGSLRAKWQLL